ncbi:MAG TPA: FtsX-like permease family protein [Candidatus Moranbacteria bacterium]|jgi:putative ABC transport system permease protein|nr:FtsX-like permease family protein [Candidatus Moranbacteria bacterium]
MLRNFFIACWFSFKQLTRSNKKSVVMTIVVVSLLFINILFIASMMSGLIKTINNQVIDYQYGNIVIEPTKESESDNYIKQANQTLNDIRSIPGVIGAVEHYKEGVKITYDQKKEGTNVKDFSGYLYSVIPSEESNVLKINSKIVSGRYLEDGDRGKILLGREISGGFEATLERASLGGVRVGDEVYVYYPNGISRKYTVAGIFATKSFLADAQAYVTKDEMEDVLGQHDLADEIIVKTATMGDENKYISKIENVLEQKLKLYIWSDFLGALSTVTNSFDFVKLIFYAIGLAVSGASIFIIIYIDLLNQKKQIGILKAIGMESKTIVISYVLQAFFYGLMGVILGRFLLEYAISPYFLKHPLELPIGYISLNIESLDLMRTEISMVVVSLIAGFIPSVQIARKNILDSIFK